MALFGFLKRKPEIKERALEYAVPEKIFIQPEGPYWEYSEEMPAMLNFNNLLSGFYGSQNFITLFYSVPEVFAPVHEIAKRVSDGNFQLRKEWNDQIDYSDADYNRLFTQPNPLVSFKDFVYQAVCYEILTGRQLFFFNKPKTLPDEYKSIITWSNLPAHKVHAELKKNMDPYTATSINDFVTQYEMPLNNGKRIFPTEQVLPICHLSLDDGYNINCCKPLIMGAEKAIRNLIPVYEARGIIYIKRGAMGFLVSKKGDASGNIALTPKEKESLMLSVNDMYGLHRAKSTIGVTDQPVDFVKTSMSISEMQPFEETLADALAIYTCLRVPRHLVPNKNNTNYDNAATDMKSFYSDVIIPWGKRYAEAWTSYMKLKDSRRYIYADYSHVDILQENRKEKADVDKTVGDTYLQRFQNGICTLNDWIVASDGNKVAMPLYDKKIFEMEEEELNLVKAALNLKSPVQPEAESDKSQNDVP